jgi:D-aminoacyl-tRNA deacylase
MLAIISFMETLFTQTKHFNRGAGMILIVASNKDIASLNIKQQILSHYPFKETLEIFQQDPIYSADLNGKNIILATLSQESVNAQNLPESFPDAQIIVFISRHSSASGKPTLSVHTPGNFSEAGLGGLPKLISVSPATAMCDALKELFHWKEKLSLDYEVSYECTHHGPSLKMPAMFVELGSSEEQWSDSKAALAVAQSAMTAMANFPKTANSVVLGIGGTHYNHKFTSMALAGEAVFGHMIPKYAVSTVETEMLRQCMEKTLEKVSFAVLDWKGIRSEDKPKLLCALQDVGLPFKKV